MNKILIFGYVALMIAIIVTVDILFFRDHVLERLISNIAIVAAFIAIYFQFLK